MRLIRQIDSTMNQHSESVPPFQAGSNDLYYITPISELLLDYITMVVTYSTLSLCSRKLIPDHVYSSVCWKSPIPIGYNYPVYSDDSFFCFSSLYGCFFPFSE